MAWRQWWWWRPLGQRWRQQRQWRQQQQGRNDDDDKYDDSDDNNDDDNDDDNDYEHYDHDNNDTNDEDIIDDDEDDDGFDSRFIMSCICRLTFTARECHGVMRTVASVSLSVGVCLCVCLSAISNFRKPWRKMFIFEEFIFDMQVRRRNRQLQFVYEGHRVKVSGIWHAFLRDLTILPAHPAFIG